MLKQLAFLTLIIALPYTTFASEQSKSSFPAELKNSLGENITLNPKDNEITVLEWFNPGCPFVKKFYSNDYIQKLQENYTSKGVKWYSINSTTKDHADHIKEADRLKLLNDWKIEHTTMLYDDEGKFGKNLSAKTTPHIFIFKGQELQYTGAIDDSPDSDSEPSKANNHLINSLNSLLEGKEITIKKTRPYGCSVKY